MASSVIKAKEHVETGTINGALGFTIQWRKVNNLVQLYMYNDTTKVPNGNTDIITLPENLKPKLLAMFECSHVVQNQCSFSISPATGRLIIYCNIPTGSSSPYYITGSTVYMT